MKRICLRSFLSVLSLAVMSCLSTNVSLAQTPKRVLVVTVTKGFRHSSIPTAEKILGELARKDGSFTVDYVRNDQEMAEKMTSESLKKYDGVIFGNTTGDLPLPDKQAFLDWIKSGKAFIGMHSASDTFDGKDGVDPYIEMLGGEFKTHGDQAGVECLISDVDHPATKHLKKGKLQSYCIEQEEMYLLKNFDASKVHQLLYLDKHPNNKKEAGRFPVAWCKNYGEGKVFYTSLGHREDVWENQRYQAHILGGIKWALGLEDGDASPGNK